VQLNGDRRPPVLCAFIEHFNENPTDGYRVMDCSSEFN
jgi:hypothetical protein